MNFIAIKMLVGDRAKYLGIIMGITFASLLITQQLSIFVGLMSRTFGFITDTRVISEARATAEARKPSPSPASRRRRRRSRQGPKTSRSAPPAPGR